MRVADDAAPEQLAVVLGGVDLAGLAAQRVDARVERAVAATRGIDRERADHERGLQHRLEIEQGMQRQRGRGLRAVDQGQAFLGAELERRNAGPLQRKTCRDTLAVLQHVAFADQRQRHVRQRCEVARGADRTLRRHIGHEARVVHGQQRVDHHFAHARVAARQAGGLEREHEAHDLGRERFADADAVRADQVELQRLQLRLADALVGQLAKAGVDAVDRHVAVGGALHHALAGADRIARRDRNAQLDHIAVNRLQLFQRDAAGFKAQGARHVRGLSWAGSGRALSRIALRSRSRRRRGA